MENEGGHKVFVRVQCSLSDFLVHIIVKSYILVLALCHKRS